MNTIQKCRFLAGKIKEMCGVTEESQLLEDAANEIEDLMSSYQALFDCASGKKTPYEINAAMRV